MDTASASMLYLCAASITMENNNAKMYATHEEMKNIVRSDSLDQKDGLLFNLFLENVYISTLQKKKKKKKMRLDLPVFAKCPPSLFPFPCLPLPLPPSPPPSLPLPLSPFFFPHILVVPPPGCLFFFLRSFV